MCSFIGVEVAYSEVKRNLDILSVYIGEETGLFICGQFVCECGCRYLTDERNQEAEEQGKGPHSCEVCYEQPKIVVVVNDQSYVQGHMYETRGTQFGESCVLAASGDLIVLEELLDLLSIPPFVFTAPGVNQLQET